MIKLKFFFCLYFALIFNFGGAKSIGSVLVSSLFDNFCIECPRASGAQRLSIRMVQSQGNKRQDSLYTMSCNHIKELYPWSDIPSEIDEIDREDCHYSPAFDPILDSNIGFTCKKQEYVAGIIRLSDTRIQVECCKMRSRQEISCNERRFFKPVGSNVHTEIEYNNQLINALAIEEQTIFVRFCDLAPRSFDDIKNDVPSTTTKSIPKTTTILTTTTTTTTTIQPTNNTIKTSNSEQLKANIFLPKKVIKMLQKPIFYKKGNLSTSIPPIAPNLTSTVSSTTIKEFTENNIKRTEMDSTQSPISSSKTEAQTTQSIETTNALSKIELGKPKKTDDNVLIFKSSTKLPLNNSFMLTQSSELPLNNSFMSTQSSLSQIKTTAGPNIESIKLKKENKLVSKTIIPLVTTNIKGSTRLLQQNVNNELPTEKDYENVEEATVELINLIAALKQESKDAKNNLNKVKAAGLPQLQQNKFNDTNYEIAALKNLEELNSDKTPAENSFGKSMEKKIEKVNDESRIGDDDYDEEVEEISKNLKPVLNSNILVQTTVKSIETIANTTTKTTQSFGTKLPITQQKLQTQPTTVLPTNIGTIEHEKVLSRPPGHLRFAQIVPHPENKVNTEIEAKNRNGIDLANTKKLDSDSGKNFDLFYVTEKNESLEEKSSTISRQIVLESKKETTFAPFEAFPLPPPGNHAKTLTRQLPKFQKIAAKANFQTITTTTAIPRQIKQTTIKKKNENIKEENIRDAINEASNEEFESETKFENVGQLTTTSLFHDQNFVDQFGTIQEELKSKMASMNNALPKRKPTKSFSKKLYGSVLFLGTNNQEGEPYVDEETNSSPFDEYKYSSSVLQSRQQKRNLATETSQKNFNDEIAAFEETLKHRQQLRRQVQQQKENALRNTAIEIDIFGGGAISASSSMQSRFESPKHHFDKQNYFDEFTEIRRAPTPRISNNVLNKIRQQLINTNQKKHLSKMAKTYVPIEFVENQLEPMSQEIIENNSTTDTRQTAKSEESERMFLEYTKPKSKPITLSLQKDGAKNYIPQNNKAVSMPSIVVYDTINSKNFLPNVEKKKNEAEHKKIKSDIVKEKTVIINNLVPMEQKDEEHEFLKTKQKPMSSIVKSKQNPIMENPIIEFTTLTVAPEPESLIQTTTVKKITTLSRNVDNQLDGNVNQKNVHPLRFNEDELEPYWNVRSTQQTKFTTPSYDLVTFYYLPKHRSKPQPREKVLTFCSKETAIRDSDNLIIACGGDEGAWEPKRCPPSTDCFVAADTTYRICCAVGFA